MKLYEINEEILALLTALDPDPETGELPENYDEMLARLDALEMDRGERLQWIAKEILNLRADADAQANEIKRLQAKKKAAETKAENLMQILDRECGGTKTDLGVAVVSYRKTDPVVIDDEAATVAWLLDNEHTEAIKYTAPTVNKIELKKIIKSGDVVEGAHIEPSMSCSLK